MAQKAVGLRAKAVVAEKGRAVPAVGLALQANPPVVDEATRRPQKNSLLTCAPDKYDPRRQDMSAVGLS